MTCAARTARLIQEVIEAQTEADVLHHKTIHLQELTKKIQLVLKIRQAQRTLTPTPLLRSIESSLTECAKNVRLLQVKLEPLAVPGGRRRGTSFAHRIAYVCSQNFIRSQESVIGTYIDILTLDFILLQNLDQSAARRVQTETLAVVQSLALTLGGNAADAQADLLQSTHDETLEITEDLELEYNDPEQDPREDANAGDGDAPILDFVNVCPACRERNIIVPEGPLAIAVKHRQATHVKNIIKADDADISVRDAEDWTLLHHAAHNVDLEIVEALLHNPKGCALIDDVTQQRQTALMLVAQQVEVSDSLAIAQVLIKSGCNVNIKDSSDSERCALYFAMDGPKTERREAFVNLLSRSRSELAWVRKNLQDRFKHYPVLEDRFRKEAAAEGAAGEDQEEDRPSMDSRISIRRLSKVFTGGN